MIVGGDLGIRKAIMIEDGLAAMPTPKEVEERAEPWRPNRSLACLYLWESLSRPSPTRTGEFNYSPPGPQ